MHTPGRDALLGLDETMLDVGRLEAPVHRAIVDDLLALRGRAEDAGFTLALASGFRSFARQLSIWNAKASGQRPVLNTAGEPLALESLSRREQVFAILRWSALPGGSRHHWGTDVDVFDSAALEDGQRLALTVEETRPGGPFYEFHRWLDGELAKPDAAFYRPYSQDNGGVAPEPWHLSHRRASAPYRELMSVEVVRGGILGADILLQDEILDNLDDIYRRFIAPGL